MMSKINIGPSEVFSAIALYYTTHVEVPVATSASIALLPGYIYVSIGTKINHISEVSKDSCPLYIIERHCSTNIIRIYLMPLIFF